MHAIGGHDHVIGEGAVGIEADGLALGTHVVVAGAAIQALAADLDRRLADDVIADLAVRDAFADLGDDAGELVARNARRLHDEVDVVMIDMQVAAADARDLDLHFYPSRRRRRFRDVDDVHMPFAAGKFGQTLHCCTLLFLKK